MTVKNATNIVPKIKTAVVLAAGRGIRLAGRGTEIPKGFLSISERPMIAESLEHLASTGIERVVIVIGHLSHFYVEFARHSPIPVELVHNPQYAASGTIYSLCCARPNVDESFVLLESDLIYERRGLSELLRTPHENAILLADIGDETDVVYVEADGDRVSKISKDRGSVSRTIAGQYIGIAKISPELFAAMSAWAETAFLTSLKYEYDQDCLSQLAALHSLRCCVVPGLIWAEVDTEVDYHRATEQVHPRLVQAARAS